MEADAANFVISQLTMFGVMIVLPLALLVIFYVVTGIIDLIDYLDDRRMQRMQREWLASDAFKRPSRRIQSNI